MKLKLITAAVAAALMTGVANAHAHLESAMPADGATVPTSPESIMLMFSEAAKLTALTIQKDGEEAQKLGPLPAKAAVHLMVAAPKLAPGHYTVDYRVVSDDTHVMSGKVKFTVAAPK
jgi:methionine-rich copper-binding protein CopC